MFCFRALMPEGWMRLQAYRKRFRCLGLPTKWAFSRKYRMALEISNIEILPRWIRDANLVVDVGANVGDWSVSIARLTKAKRIVAFEPIPQVFEELCHNVASFPQIHCVNSAIGAEIGYVTIHVEENTALSSVFPISDAGRNYHGLVGKQSCMISVPCTTLDAMFAESTEIDLLKIDVQGYEERCLWGGANTLRRTRAVLIEVMFQPYYNGAKDFTDLFRTILSIDDRFRFYSISAPHCSVDGIPLWADAVFVRR